MSETIAKGIINYRNKLVSSVSKKERKTAEVGKTQKNKTSIKKNNTDVVFKIQILASSKSKIIRKGKFKSLNNISKSKEGKIYKYYYGSVNTFNEARALKNKAVKVGFKDSFIVAFKNGKKINISDVIQTNN